MKYYPKNCKALIEKLYQHYDFPIAEVVKLTKMSRSTVSRFFKLEKIRPTTRKTIYKSILQLIEDVPEASY